MRVRILVADDDVNIREYLRFILAREGYAVLEAEDGEQASMLLESEMVHLPL